MQSRLSRNLENKTKKKLLLTLGGTVLLLFLLIKFGIPFLINFSLFLAGSKATTQQAQSSSGNKIFIPAPMLNQTFSATNSASVTITGSSLGQSTVMLYVNDTFTDTVTAKADGSFTFTNVTLSSGANTVKVKTKKDTSESDYSDPVTITFQNKAPTLTIDSPSDGQSFTKDQDTIVVKGKTDTDIRVTVNDFWAIVDSSGNYTYTLHLSNGDNHIKVDATDSSGNKSEKTIKVTYSQ